MSSVVTDPRGTSVSEVDFRRPSRVSRDAIVALEANHELFARRLATTWSSSSYAALEIEHVTTDQLSLDDFVRALPVPTVLGLVHVAALDATAFIQVDLPFALLVVERLLGGVGDADEAIITRRPTELEQALLAHELLEPAVVAIDDAFKDLTTEPSRLLGMEIAPQPLQLGSPGDLLLLPTYRVEIRGDLPAQGLVTLAYPVAQLVPQLDRLLLGNRGVEEHDRDLYSSPLAETVLDAALNVRVRLGGSGLPASVLAALQPGDVLRLDHPVDRPADLIVDERHLGTAYLGKRGRKLAVQVAEPPTPPRPARSPASGNGHGASAPDLHATNGGVPRVAPDEGTLR
ncbi:MAG: flagellar motor switch protein FliM [Nitriliruptoraceae bacterium]